MRLQDLARFEAYSGWKASSDDAPTCSIRCGAQKSVAYAVAVVDVSHDFPRRIDQLGVGAQPVVRGVKFGDDALGRNR